MTRLPPDAVLPEGAWDAHCHIFPPGYAAAPDCPPAPAGATLDGYRAVSARLGIARAVVVQPNAYGTDNSALIATLGAMEEGTVGVAAVSPGTPEAELQRLHDAGVRGARVMDLGGGRVPLAQLEDVIAMVRPWGWVPVVQFDGTALADHAQRLGRIDVPWVLDHYGKVLAGATPAHVDALKRLQDAHCTLKFAAHYEASVTGPPDYADIATLARAAVGHAPERVVWGSNWPHLLNGPDDKPDDAALLETVLEWVPEEAREAVFVHNPARLFADRST